MADQLPSPNQHLPLDLLNKYLIYTTSSSVPKIIKTLTSVRCMIRVFQLLAAASKFTRLIQGAFSTLFYTCITNPPSSLIVYRSGISMMNFTSISGFFVALVFIIVQLYPQYFNVAPDRHLRFSRTEISFDLVLMVLWITSSTVLLLMGDLCSFDRSQNCIFIYSSSGLGYFASLLFASTMIIGIKDTLKNKDGYLLNSKDHIMFARGNWKF